MVIIQYYTLMIQEAVTVCACSDHHHTQKETVYLDVLLAMYVHDVHVPLACGRKCSMGNVCSHFLSPSHTQYNDWDNNSCHRFDWMDWNQLSQVESEVEIPADTNNATKAEYFVGFEPEKLVIEVN